MSAQKVLLATLTGIVVGLLIAPAKGSETRQKIADSADNVKRKFRRFRTVADDELDDLKNTFEHEIYGLQDDVREKVLKLIHASRHSYNHMKEDAMAN